MNKVVSNNNNKAGASPYFSIIISTEFKRSTTQRNGSLCVVVQNKQETLVHLLFLFCAMSRVVHTTSF